MSKQVAANSWQKNNITHKKTAENDKIVIKIAENIGDDSKEISELIDQKLKDDTDNNDENDD